MKLNAATLIHWPSKKREVAKSKAFFLKMTLLESIRDRLRHKLESHQVEEDFSVCPRSSVVSSSSSNSSLTVSTGRSNMVFENGPSFANGVFEMFDPDETVPSYESSQMMYEQQQHRDLTASTSMGSPTLSRSGSGVASSQAASASSVQFNGSFSKTSKTGKKNIIKTLGLKFLNPKEHFALACCRDLSLVPCLIGLFESWKRVFNDTDLQASKQNVFYSLAGKELHHSITSARSSEHFLTGVWCIVAGYLSFSVLDNLMIRWIVTYLTSAAIVRMLSMSLIIMSAEQYLVSTFSAEGYKYGLHIWILISCGLTLCYIGQNFVTLNLDLKRKTRAKFFDFYNIAVFAVVPVGLASFITMIGLLRSLLILRLDIQNKVEY